MDWKEWFKNHVSLSFWGMSTTRHQETGRILGMESYQYSDHTEEMYQAFKARLIEELIVDNPDFRVMGILKERIAREEL